MMENPLDSFSPLTREWFRATFGAPTPPQAQGWLPIQRGEHALILAPTGSGKTLAAFLWGVDALFRELEDDKRRTIHGVRLLYVSPLKALNNDIERNLRVPLEGIRNAAARLGVHLPLLRVAVRTGDTPSSARADMLKHPPHILITTPESLYLMLTSPRARKMFRTVRTAIVDEIHTLCGDKRGAHLALSLERLEELAEGSIQRIGLSATIKPLEEAARYLGGGRIQDARTSGSVGMIKDDEGAAEWQPRPVTIVDARYEKKMELEVVTVVDDFRELPGESIWASVVPSVLQDVRRHHTTLIFASNRRLAERTADRLNAQLQAEQSEEIPPGSSEALAPGGRMRDRGIFAIGAQGPIRAHHGSMSKEARREMEEDLKAGKLPALVGTSSLELGIDIGAVDLVVQLQSPKSVAHGLQRVGRSGHLVGQTSRGKIYATFREDLVEAAAIARGMREGDVELTYTPQNPLDVLSQQIVAMVAMEDWDARELYNVVRRAYPYRDLPYRAFVSVLEMLAGKYYMHAPGARAVAALRAKIAWDRVGDRLTALPGSRLHALANVGTIPDTGAYKVYLSDNKTRVGELDEEFVFETRTGDTFLLGTNVWRALEIKDDRVIVADAAGATPRMPFWRGDYPWRPFELGERIGRLRREVAGLIETAGEEEATEVLERDYMLDQRSARNLVEYVRRQKETFDGISSDRTIVVETFLNAVGDPHLVIHSPFGGRVNGAWALALSSALRERLGVTPETMTNDDGIIFRLAQTDIEFPLDIVTGMTAAEARARILKDLPDSPVFGARFRMNAARALLLAKTRAGKRTPFWLQRLKAKDLLAFVRRFPDFPILVETYRDCLWDVFDLPHLEHLLDRIAAGELRVLVHESAVPSPIAAGLLFNFVGQYLYEWDAPKAERSLQLLSVQPEALADVLKGVEWADLLKPAAVAEVVSRAQHLAPGTLARTVEELVLVLEELGDLTTEELVARSSGDARAWLEELARAGRVTQERFETPRGSELRWVSVSNAARWGGPVEAGAGHDIHLKWAPAGPNAARILHRYLQAAGPVPRSQILERYAFDAMWLEQQLASQVVSGVLVKGHFTTHQADEYCDSHLLEQIHRRTLTILRGEVQPVDLAAYADFLARWQHIHPQTRLRADKLNLALRQLQGADLPGIVWERDILPARVWGYASALLDELWQTGEWVWVGSGRDPRRGRVRLFPRGQGALFMSPPNLAGLSSDALKVYAFLQEEGASFAVDIQRATGLGADALASVLVELAVNSLATNDDIVALRSIIEHGSIQARGTAAAEASRIERARLSALEVELDARLGPRRLSSTRYREAKRRIASRVARTVEAQASPWRGRWALVHRSSILGPEFADQDRAERIARLLLERYGILAREMLETEDWVGDWTPVYAQWQRMELRGEVRRGYFVSGLSGVQYALPEAVEQLRASLQDDAPVVLNATDPAIPFGAAPDGPRVTRIPSTLLVLIKGQPILIAEDNGERLRAQDGANADVISRALHAWLTRPNAARRVIVKEWNGGKAIGSAGEALLRAEGFYRVPGGLEWWHGSSE